MYKHSIMENKYKLHDWVVTVPAPHSLGQIIEVTINDYGEPWYTLRIGDWDNWYSSGFAERHLEKATKEEIEEHGPKENKMTYHLEEYHVKRDVERRMKMTTDINVLLDRSGSMASIREETEMGYNDFLRQQRNTPGKAQITLVQFDSVGIDNIYTAMPLKNAPKLVLEPRGMTPLLDAIGKTINDTKTRLLSERKKINQVLFVIVTDGLENFSKHYTKASVNALISEAQDKLDWQFIYLGANQDAIQEAQRIGIRDHAYNYIASPIHTERLWGAVGQTVSCYRSSGEMYMAATASAGIMSASANGYDEWLRGQSS